ncbi:MAG TPA: S-layer homology domain-containing protein, partial [Candidatus Obscuribacter sp.]|nr:S-layer homology domain-containing protein [Candidatus Obscuribacter sp.]
SLSDWEVMTLNRDLERLDSDVVRLMAAHSVTPAAAVNAPFDTKGHWAESYVGQLTQRSIIGGFPDGSFKPDDGITRAQFAAIAMKALNVPAASGPATFKDVAPTYWANKAIAAVSQAGLVTGFPDGSFKPEDKITRAQALVILAKALPTGLADTSILNSYQDGSSVPAWAAPSVAKAAKARILVSYPDPSAIKPNVNATRADVAALTYQTLINLGQKLPMIKVGLEK